MFRHELKFECTAAELEKLRCNLSAVMEYDSHALVDGTYHIRSVYFDTLDDMCMMENENGTQPREKWRIRAYNADCSYISLECKHKEHGMIHKTTCRLTRPQYDYLVNGIPVPISAENPSLLNRFSLLVLTDCMRPKVIVGYDRTSFVCAQGNIRICFDCDIFASQDFDSFFAEAIVQRPIFTTGKALLEVKYDAYLPEYIQNAAHLNDMRRSTFSKYYLCRNYNIY